MLWAFVSAHSKHTAAENKPQHKIYGGIVAENAENNSIYQSVSAFSQRVSDRYLFPAKTAFAAQKNPAEHGNLMQKRQHMVAVRAVAVLGHKGKPVAYAVIYGGGVSPHNHAKRYAYKKKNIKSSAVHTKNLSAM